MTRQAGYYPNRPVKQKIFKDVICPFSRYTPHGSSLGNFCTKIKPILDHCPVLCVKWPATFSIDWFFNVRAITIVHGIITPPASHITHHAFCMVVTSSGARAIGQIDTIEVTNIWHPAHIYWQSAKCHAWHPRDMSSSLLHVTDPQHHGQDGASGVQRESEERKTRAGRLHPQGTGEPGLNTFMSFE